MLAATTRAVHRRKGLVELTFHRVRMAEGKPGSRSRKLGLTKLRALGNIGACLQR